MRVRTAGLVLGLVLLALGIALAVTGCGGTKKNNGLATAGGNGTASASASAGLSDQDRMLRFARCMRENGVPDFPDPKVNSGGGISLDAPDGADAAKVDAA